MQRTAEVSEKEGSERGYQDSPIVASTLKTFTAPLMLPYLKFLLYTPRNHKSGVKKAPACYLLSETYSTVRDSKFSTDTRSAF